MVRFIITRQKLISSSFCLMLIFSCIFTMQARVKNQRATSKNTAVADIAIVDISENNSELFVAKAQEGVISSRRINFNNSINNIINSDELKPFYTFEKGNVEPTMITYHKGSLINYDQKKPAILELNLDSKVLKTILDTQIAAKLLNKEQFTIFEKAFRITENPMSITVSDSGDIALAGDDSRNIILYKRNAEKLMLLDYQTETDEPQRMCFWRNLLLVLNEAGLIYGLNIDSEKIINNPLPIPVYTPDVVSKPIKVRDFTINNNNLYLTDSTKIISFKLEPELFKSVSMLNNSVEFKNSKLPYPLNLIQKTTVPTTSIPIIFENTKNSQLSRIIASKTGLFSLDTNSEQIRIFKPSRISIKLDEGV